MQNATMRHFFEEADAQYLSEEVLQESMLKTRRGMPMRKALIGELVWLDDQTSVEDGGEDEKLFNQLKLEWV